MILIDYSNQIIKLLFNKKDCHYAHFRMVTGLPHP